MLVNLLTDHWVVCKGREPLLWTASKQQEVAIKKWEKREGKNWNKNNGYTIINVDISVKDLNLDD